MISWNYELNHWFYLVVWCLDCPYAWLLAIGVNVLREVFRFTELMEFYKEP